YDKSRRRRAIHVIGAFSTMHSLVIGQIKTDEQKLPSVSPCGERAFVILPVALFVFENKYIILHVDI
ncbi:hypothetical protein DMY24_10430, partial [Escherichia coli]|nr:hypothetical protein [Escherichia coli]